MVGEHLWAAAVSADLKQAMVLAAGFGKRMKPLTDAKPKPLIEVAGRTLLDHALDAIAGAEIPKVTVNVHYLADQIEDHVKARDDIDVAISDERAEILDSGGGVKAALPLFNDGPLAVLNADTFWCERSGSTLARLGAAFDPDTMDMLLLLVRHEDAVGFDGAGDFTLGKDGRLARRGDAATAPYIYAGVAVMLPSLTAGEADEAFSLNRLFDRAIAQGRLYGQVLDGLWLHVGTPAAISLAEEALAGFQSGED
jgi:MurNAc alpha-1-phosphate uridylyltransferase